MKYLKLLKAIAFGLVVAVGLALFALSHQLGGFRAFVVLSGSMEPTLRVGSLVISQSVDPRELQSFDIVTFVRPDNPREFITHRILGKVVKDDIPVFQTFGDNNSSIDNWKVVGGAVVGKVILHIPYVGYMLSITQGKVAILFLIIIPAVFIVTDELRTIGRMLQQRRSGSVLALTVIGFGILCIFQRPLQTTYSLLTETVVLQENSYIVRAPDSIPSPSPELISLPPETIETQ